jgi:hypothetical protein
MQVSVFLQNVTLLQYKCFAERCTPTTRCLLQFVVVHALAAAMVQCVLQRSLAFKSANLLGSISASFLRHTFPATHCV